MKVVVALWRFRAPVGHKRVVASCRVQVVALRRVPMNVKFIGGSPGWLLLAGGCLMT